MRISEIVFVLGCGISAFAQTPNAGNGFVKVVIQNRIEPPLPAGAVKTIRSGVMVGQPRIFHRYFTDSTQRKYFGYDLRLDQSGVDAVQITIQPLSETPSTLELGPGWSLVRLPSYPGPQIVKNGDIVILDLLVNPATGQKIVDNFLVRCEAKAAPSSTRDFTVADATLRLVAPRLTVNGKSFESGSNSREDSVIFRDFALGIAGLGDIDALVGGDSWVYLSGHGRFIFSLTPRSGFRKAGQVTYHQLSFEIAGNKYVLTSRDRIASGPGTYNVYVLHDPDYHPKGAGKEPVFLQGAGL